MLKVFEKVNMRSRRLKVTVAIVSVIAVLATCAGVYAWFSNNRRAAALAEISDPTAFFINAGNEEDVRYLDLGGIDVETENKYKDFVVCVRGQFVHTYKIQLAYTTNNQFEFELYDASMTTSQGAVPGDAKCLSVYDTHDGSGDTQYYYAPNSAVAYAGTILNLDTSASEKLAKTDDGYYTKTYKPAGSAVTYDNRHKYAVPLYWQTDNTIRTSLDANNEFSMYFILRVKWDADLRNEKETDIVYIAAKNITA